MTTYIALLRAINVGGHSVTMERLRSLFTELGLTNVRSYIQTGNVFFASDKPVEELRNMIENHLEAELGFPVPTFIRTLEQYAYSLAVAPFQGEPDADTRYMVFSLAEPLQNPEFPLKTPLGDYEVLGATETEAFVRVTLLKGKMSNSNALEKLLGVSGTARFFHTAKKILAAAQEG